MLGFFNPVEFVQHLVEVWVGQYPQWSYFILMAVIFCETGLVIAPFLPGDSLLFLVGTLAANDADGPQLNVWSAWLLLALAAVLGDNCNYWIGRLTGPKIFHKDNVRFLNKEYLHRAHEFYQRHGGKAVVIARFAPILRTFAPFVAGIGSMSYGRFVAFSVCGSLAWIAAFVFGGYYFGGMSAVKQNFSLVIIAIVVISLTPAFITFLRGFLRKRKRHDLEVEVVEESQDVEQP
jgi:membrane-associated protein